MNNRFLSFLIILITSISATASTLFLDKQGFPRCVQIENKTYIFEWDKLSKTEKKSVFYFSLDAYASATGHLIKNCDDEKYITQIPNEILTPLNQHKNLFSDYIVSALSQVASGAHIYRSDAKATEFIENNSNLFKTNSNSNVEYLINSYGTEFTTELISEWSNKLFSQHNSCESLIGSCDFYLCQEQKKSCGLSGYNVGYGFKYCTASKFKLINNMHTDYGKKWVTEVFQCLQKNSLKLDYTSTNLTCDTVKTTAIDSHADCYINAGFCNLKLSEKIEIFKIIKKEIISKDTLRQAYEILNKCNDSSIDKNLILRGVE